MTPPIEEIAAVYGPDRAPAILAAIREGGKKRPGWHPSHAVGEYVAKVAEAAGHKYDSGYDQSQGLEGGPLARFYWLSADDSYTPSLVYDSETDSWQITAWGDLVEEFDVSGDDPDPEPDPLEEFRGYQLPQGPFADWIIAVQMAYLESLPETEPRGFAARFPAPKESWAAKGIKCFEPLTERALRAKIEAVCSAYLCKLPEGWRLDNPEWLGQDIAWGDVDKGHGSFFDALWDKWLDDGCPSFELTPAGLIRVTL